MGKTTETRAFSRYVLQNSFRLFFIKGVLFVSWNMDPAVPVLSSSSPIVSIGKIPAFSRQNIFGGNKYFAQLDSLQTTFFLSLCMLTPRHN